MNTTKEVQLIFKNEVYRFTAAAGVTIEDVKLYLYKCSGIATEYMKVANAVFTNIYVENCFKIHNLYKNVDPRTNKTVLKFELYEPNCYVPTLKEVIGESCRKRGIQLKDWPRKGKRLLVLDIDGTLCDDRLMDTQLESCMDRPYLHYFLESIYPYYDIVLWSCTNMQAIERKVNSMQINNNIEFKIMAYIDKLITKQVEAGGVGPILTKPLIEVFRYFRQYNFKNTIICDDQLHNFLYNPHNGLGVPHYYYEDKNKDNCLIVLRRYLLHLASCCTNFSYHNHLFWSEYAYEQVRSLQDIVALYFKDHNIKILNRPRSNKKLLLLDIDHTICDPELFDTEEEANAGRPHLHHFLENVYPYYDIGLWCYYDLSLVEQRAKLLGLENNSNYKLTFYISSMYYEYGNVHGVGITTFKPLERIFNHFRQYGKSNTILCDDNYASYSANYRNALPVLPYTHENRGSDVVLLKLEKYLKNIISPYCNFFEIGHSLWYKTLEASITYKYSVPTLKECVNYYLARRGIKILDKVRLGKKLLVLDFDFTLYDSTYFKSKLEHLAVRPYLHDLLKSAYEDYNIAIWSNTKMIYLEEKLNALNINRSSDYSILCLLDNKATAIRTLDVHHEPVAVKPLENIYRYMKMFNSSNTLICDDQVLNFYYDANNGIRIKGYNMFTRRTDKELLQLKIYLKYLASNFDDFSDLHHLGWFHSPGASLYNIIVQNMSSLSGMLKWYFKELGMEFVNSPRKNKKLLILNAEYVICDESVLCTKDEANAGRPYLHSFLASVYQYYDIVIWYSCRIVDIHKRMQTLGIANNPNYKILLYINGASAQPKRIVRIVAEVKPLRVLWEHLKCYNYTNTIICDHDFDSYFDNEDNGILIKIYFREYRLKDKFLLRLTKYLIEIAEQVDDFSLLDHSNWEVFPETLKYEQFEPSSLVHIVNSFLLSNGLEVLNRPRKNKKLLVLDTDHILLDPTYHGRSDAYQGARPYLHDFLRSVSKEYDIGFWSNNTLYHLRQKLQLLSILQNTEYPCVFYADINASRRSKRVPLITIWEKPLSHIFRFFDEYSYRNTVICDIEHVAYQLKIRNGLKVSVYCRAYRSFDNELLRLKKYLHYIAINYNDFTDLNHDDWASFSYEPLE